APVGGRGGADRCGLGRGVGVEEQRDLPADLRLPVDRVLTATQRGDVKGAAGAGGMGGAVVKEGGAAIDARVDPVGLEPRLTPRVAAAAAQSHAPVLPILVGQLLDP